MLYVPIVALLCCQSHVVLPLDERHIFIIKHSHTGCFSVHACCPCCSAVAPCDGNVCISRPPKLAFDLAAQLFKSCAALSRHEPHIIDRCVSVRQRPVAESAAA